MWFIVVCALIDNYTFCISFRENKQSFALKVKQ